MIQAYFTRDALAKGLYQNLFSWVVDRINENIRSTQDVCEVVIGILDIYGFEIMVMRAYVGLMQLYMLHVSQELNSFEQFCINYCNEKLQQLFINNVMRAEQAEYAAEGELRKKSLTALDRLV